MDVVRRSSLQTTYLMLGLLFIARNVAGLNCYQCDSTEERTCAETLTQHHTLSSESCDQIQGAEFCIKMTGMVEGKLGTQRFCSARDYGNYCEWVQRPGDERQYRACVYTCLFDGCNHAPSTTTVPTTLLLMLLPLLLLAN